MDDPRKLEYMIYDLNEERDDILNLLKELEEKINQETDQEKLDKLKQEKQDLLDDLHDVDCDIAMYKEMMDKLFPSEIGLCGFSCDGLCQTCKGGGYDASEEVFTGGDY
jgi:hypothetical protein